MTKRTVNDISLKSVADAIRERLGAPSSYPLWFPDGFESAVKGIPKGVVEAEWNDVVFIDYDGTVLYSYTLAEMQALTELPPLPSHDGLICQEWNWTLADIKAMNRSVIVGATYTTDDGATRLHIRISAPLETTIPLYFNQSIANGITINWGDGSNTETVSGTGYVNTTHTYSKNGDYVISLLPTGNCTLGLGANDASTCVLGNVGTNASKYGSMLKEVNIGKNISPIGNHSLKACVNLQAISIPNTCAYYGNEVWGNCKALESIVIPKCVGYIGYAMMTQCASLCMVSFPNEVGDKINGSTFTYCFSLPGITIPETQTTIPSSILISCESMHYVKIPTKVTSIGNAAFRNCFGLEVLDFTSCTSIPTLSNANAFEGLPSGCEIRVPASLYSGWIAATNWSNFASQIVGV